MKNQGSQVTTLDRYRGSLLGLAAGDALGTTLEFRRPGSFEPVADIVGGGPFHLRPGEWTDDTSMALCLAESLIDLRRFDPVDQLNRYVLWWQDGHLSSTGECFDIGITTSAALGLFLRTGKPFCGSTDRGASGNGCIMRLAPVPLFFARDPAEAMDRSADSSRTTHGSTVCVSACRYFGGLIVGAVSGADKQVLLAPRYSPVPGYWDAHPMEPEIDTVAAGSFRDREPPVIRGTGYVVQSLEAALWAFHKTDNFRDGALLAVNLGDDADTTGAVYGQLAGAFYGVGNIPETWRNRLAMRMTIETMADNLYAP
jgi:ADP-ribosylglycohydrolase